MSNYANLSKEELLEVIDDLESDIWHLEADIKDLKSERISLGRDVDQLESEVSTLEYELSLQEKLKTNLRDELKFEFLIENWDKITLDSLEFVVQNKFSENSLEQLNQEFLAAKINFEDELEEFHFLKSSLKDELKYDFIKENWIEITLEDLEQIIKTKNK